MSLAGSKGRSCSLACSSGPIQTFEYGTRPEGCRMNAVPMPAQALGCHRTVIGLSFSDSNLVITVAERGLKGMRIAIFSETFLPKVDGIVTRLRNTISQLRKAGDEVLIFAPDGGIDDFEGARVIGMTARRFPLYPELRLALPRRSMGY